jgi:hypothetical protein
MDNSAAVVVVTPVVLWQIASHPGIFELARLWTNELQRLISREGRAGDADNQDQRVAASLGQFGTTSAPTCPHCVHTTPTPSDLIRV